MLGRRRLMDSRTGGDSDRLPVLSGEKLGIESPIDTGAPELNQPKTRRLLTQFGRKRPADNDIRFRKHGFIGDKAHGVRDLRLGQRLTKRTDNSGIRG